LKTHQKALLFLLFFVCGAGAVQSKIHIRSLINDAQISYSIGDLFRAHRSYAYILKKRRSLLRGKDFYFILETEFFLRGKKEFVKFCRSESAGSSEYHRAMINYQCGRILLVNGEKKAALRFLSGKQKNEKYFLQEKRLLIASAKLGLGDSKSCIQLLPNRDIDKFRFKGLLDIYRLTRARCFSSAGAGDRALREYQEIGPLSQYFVSAVEESAWLLFKMRRFESSQTMLDILISTFEGRGKERGKGGITEKIYYRSRYLKAYLSISKKESLRAARDFELLGSDFEKFAKFKVAKVNRAAEKLSRIANKISNQQAIIKGEKELSTYLSDVAVWAGDLTRRKLESSYALYKAVAHESRRLGVPKSKLIAKYASDLKHMEKVTRLRFQILARQTGVRLKRELKMLELKTQMGKVENIWMQRTEGLRSMDEIIDGYREEVESVSVYLGG
jgi:hypothetical protein